ncbi:hypothetical protein ACHWQZ_G017048 [Mnemiopsis leidyi]
MRFYLPLFVLRAISLHLVECLDLPTPSRVVEFRIELPFTVEQLEIGRRYTTIMMSKLETGGGEGVEIIINEPRQGPIPGETSGAVIESRYTHKVIYLASKVPSVIQRLAPTGSLEVHEISWNAFSYTRTYLSNHYMKEAFYFDIETQHLAGGGDRENVHQLDEQNLAKRQVIKLDLSRVPSSDYNLDTDPESCLMEKGSLSLKEGVWVNLDEDSTSVPLSTVYSLQRLTFQWWGLQEKVESIIVKAQTRLLTKYYRMLVCSSDDWLDLTMDDIEKLETEAKNELDQLRNSDTVRGITIS